MSSSVFFALCVALAASLYQVFQRQVAGVNSYLVAIAVSFTAILFALLLILLGGKVTSVDLVQGKSAWFFLILIGLCAFGVDFFTSRAYTVGGSVSMIGPVITSGVIILSGIFGMIFFKEPFTLLKAAGLILMILGVFLTSWQK
ncbi:MAG: EamA family transporter [Candidatus Moranbacteria bacterium]|nr:EamA family transporter [Candidatus Moranbacteria bacterium]